MHSLSRLDADIERITRALSTRSHARTHALTTLQVRAFLVLSKAALEGEPISAHDLCLRLDICWSTALAAVTRFVTDGLVVRQQSLEDGRVKHLLLTTEGMCTAKELEA